MVVYNLATKLLDHPPLPFAIELRLPPPLNAQWTVRKKGNGKGGIRLSDEAAAWKEGAVTEIVAAWRSQGGQHPPTLSTSNLLIWKKHYWELAHKQYRVHFEVWVEKNNADLDGFFKNTLDSFCTATGFLDNYVFELHAIKHIGPPKLIFTIEVL